MTQKMLIESDPHQTRIAVLEDDRLTEIFVERRRHRGMVGNVYKGRVTRVLPGMQAAFVDVGLERDAFLYVSDVAADVEAMEDQELGETATDEPAARGVAGGAAESPQSPQAALPAMQSMPAPPSHAQQAQQAAPSIADLLKPGQEIIVQVVKDPLPSTGARSSTHVTRPGRYVVLLPTVRHFGVSRRIDDDAERERLIGLLHQLPVAGGGLIVRTVGGVARQRGVRERPRLPVEAVGQDPPPGRQGLGPHPAAPGPRPGAARGARSAAPGVQRAVGGRRGDLRAHRRVPRPGAAGAGGQGQAVPPGRHPVFEQFGIEDQIEAALKTKVWLKSGGYIVINPTEALVAIDVNTGRFVGQRNLEDTVLQTNLEAVQEIVRQIRLRDLGGIIVIDLIDMVEQAHREEVFSSLENEIKKDRAKTKLLNISEFGLVESNT